MPKFSSALTGSCKGKGLTGYAKMEQIKSYKFRGQVQYFEMRNWVETGKHTKAEVKEILNECLRKLRAENVDREFEIRMFMETRKWFNQWCKDPDLHKC